MKYVGTPEAMRILAAGGDTNTLVYSEETLPTGERAIRVAVLRAARPGRQNVATVPRRPAEQPWQSGRFSPAGPTRSGRPVGPVVSPMVGNPSPARTARPRHPAWRPAWLPVLSRWQKVALATAVAVVVLGTCGYALVAFVTAMARAAGTAAGAAVGSAAVPVLIVIGAGVVLLLACATKAGRRVIVKVTVRG